MEYHEGTVFKPLLAYAMSLLYDIVPAIEEKYLAVLERVMDSFISYAIPYAEARNAFHQIIGITAPVDKIWAILTVPNMPLPGLSEYPADAQHFLMQKKTRQWREAEDMRLLAAIHKFGLDSWGTVASFVGNSRTKAQCSQRWTRGLDPRIAKIQWTPEEDKKLILAVSKHGIKSWTKISQELKNRSDAQCRYRYRQLEVDQKEVVQPPMTHKYLPIESLLNSPVRSSPVTVNKVLVLPQIARVVESV